MISTKLKDYLDRAGVAYARHSHTPAYTAQEIAHNAHIRGEEMVKSVVLKADEGRFVLAVLSANQAVNLDRLRDAIGCRILRLATESEFGDMFPTCNAGAMPPFGNVFNLPVYCERTLSQNREIEFNAGAHDETIRMTFENYERLVKPKMARFGRPYREGVQRLAA
jgi:Ala-tRNA(Pro) deacylase